MDTPCAVYRDEWWGSSWCLNVDSTLNAATGNKVRISRTTLSKGRTLERGKKTNAKEITDSCFNKPPLIAKNPAVFALFFTYYESALLNPSRVFARPSNHALQICQEWPPVSVYTFRWLQFGGRFFSLVSRTKIDLVLGEEKKVNWITQYQFFCMCFFSTSLLTGHRNLRRVIISLALDTQKRWSTE